MKQLTLDEIKKASGGLCLNPIYENNLLIGFCMKPIDSRGEDFCDEFFLASKKKQADFFIQSDSLVVSCGFTSKKFRLFSEELSCFNRSNVKIEFKIDREESTNSLSLYF